MVRSYRKYEAHQRFGTVCTASANVVCTNSSSTFGKTNNARLGRAYVGANEDILCWDIKTGELLSQWSDKDEKSPVTCIAQCEVQPDLIAAGYTDGSIRIWDALSSQIVVAFNGHRSAVTHLQFDREGARLASGSRDTDIIIWNLLSETAEFRLRGHKDQITGISFLRNSEKRPENGVDEDNTITEANGSELQERYLLSISKDSLIKVWDLETPHCIETHVAQSGGECWALVISPDGAGCITAGNDGELKIWKIDLGALDRSHAGNKASVLANQGTIIRQGKDRTIGVAFHPRQDYISVHGADKAVEIWRIRTTDELHKHLLRKRKRRREKVAIATEGLTTEAEDELAQPEVSDVFVPYVIVRTGGKVRSMDWLSPDSSTSKALQMLVATTNNQLEVFTVKTHRNQSKEPKGTETDYTRAVSVELPGHRADIRALALSSDDRMLASASAGQLKIWNMKTKSCLRTLECGQALCATFLPGDRIVLLGSKTGELELYDISTSTLIESFKAHDGPVWTLAVHPDGKSIVTGSADKSAKFWRFDVVDEGIPGTRRTTQRLKLTQTRQLKVSDDILSMQYSPDSRLLALSTLDNTVKVFFTDSLKLFLTLYGHKLPVLNLSISSDSKLMATCSADKNVRIWGLDFGDCHKAFFAHQDSVMAVSFIAHPMERDETHLLFSASKDGVVKSWDGDKFEQIQKLEGHHGEIWAMVIGRTGELIVTASHDKSIRTWEIGDDLIFLEEERERELEQMYEATLAENLDRDQNAEAQNGQDEVAAASKQTITTLTHGEKIIEALGISMEDLEVMRAFERDRESNPRMAAPQRNPIFLAFGNISAEQHVLNTLRKVPAPALNDALLVVPFTTLGTLFTFLAIFLKKRMQPDLAWRVTYFLLQVHMQQIVASRQLRETLQDILAAYESWQAEAMNLMGFNLAGLTIMGRDIRDETTSGYVDDSAAEVNNETIGGKKRAFAHVA